jgi:hypothetical protein
VVGVESQSIVGREVAGAVGPPRPTPSDGDVAGPGQDGPAAAEPGPSKPEILERPRSGRRHSLGAQLRRVLPLTDSYCLRRVARR